MFKDDLKVLVVATLFVTSFLSDSNLYATKTRKENMPIVTYSQQLKHLKKLHKAKDYAASSLLLEKLLLRSRAKSELLIRKAVIVKDAPKGLGQYRPLKSRKLDVRHLYVYLEVEGFLTRKIVTHEEIDLDVKGVFSYQNEKIPGEISLGGHHMFTLHNTGLTSFAVHLELSDKSPQGVYQVEIVVTDRISKKIAKRQISFEL